MKRLPPAGIIALACAMATTTQFVPGLHAQSTGALPGAADEPVELPAYEVVGSRLPRSDFETVSPVVTIDAASLAAMGAARVGDALRTLPFNSGQALTPTDSAISFTPGVSTINLRGLGNNQTLVLINGRRAVPYAAPGFNGLQTVFDFNSLPQAAIESIEILKDGGSAVYGSDAVAGVVNVRLRRDFQGVATSFELGNHFTTDALRTKAAVMAGAIDGNTSLVFIADWEEQNAVFSRDLRNVRDADKTALAPRANARYTATGWAEAGFPSEAEYLDAIGATDAIGDGWFDNRSSRGFPGYVDTTAGSFTFAEPTDNPTLDDAIEGINFYNYNETNGLFPEYRRHSFFGSARHDFTARSYGFVEASFNRMTSEVHGAETPADIENSLGLTVGSRMHIPAENAFNPFGEDIFSGRRRLVELPTVSFDITSDTTRLLAGVGGALDLGVLSGWHWEAAVLHSENSVGTVQRGIVADNRLQQALEGLTRVGDGALTWNPETPGDERVYFNWFGVNEPAMANFLLIENPTSAFLKYRSLDASAHGPWFDLPAGTVDLAIGLEHRREDFGNLRTELNATGNIVGGDEGSSSEGDRSVTSVYLETRIPVVNTLELQLAARYEDYSDGGIPSRARPKLGLKYRALPWLLLRGSYSRSFKAPDLAYLHTASQTSFSSFPVFDPVTATEIDPLQIVQAGNPDLEPERATTWYAGVEFVAPDTGPLRGWEASIDWFDIRRKDLLAQLSDFFGYPEFLAGAAAGDPLFAGRVTRDPLTNQVLFIRDDYVNISDARYRGYDLALGYKWGGDDWGDFSLGAQATYLVERRVDGGDLAGDYLSAKWNATTSFNWSSGDGDWNVNVYGVYRGRRARDLSFGTIFDEGDTLFISYTVRPQFTVNPSVTYRGFRDTQVTVGVDNVFDTRPPVDPFDPLGTTPGVNDAAPAFWYVRLEHVF